MRRAQSIQKRCLVCTMEIVTFEFFGFVGFEKRLLRPTAGAKDFGGYGSGGFARASLDRPANGFDRDAVKDGEWQEQMRLGMTREDAISAKGSAPTGRTGNVGRRLPGPSARVITLRPCRAQTSPDRMLPCPFGMGVAVVLVGSEETD